MTDPVIGKDGISYERTAILEWLARKPESPMTRVQMTASDIVPNFALRHTIEAFLSKRPKAVGRTAPPPSKCEGWGMRAVLCLFPPHFFL